MSGRNVLRLCVPILVSIASLTLLTSVPAGAHAPKIKKPGAPTVVTAIALSGGAAVSWTAPVSDGGSPVSGYTVTASHGGHTCTTTGATTCTVIGLTNGHLYTVKVRASNAKGEGPAARVQVTPSLPTVSFVSSFYFAFSGGPVGVDLSQPSSSTVQVDFATSDGNDLTTFGAAWVGDAAAFSPISGTVSFAPGETTVTIPFTVPSPNVNPGACGPGVQALQIPCYPSANVTLANPTNATLGTTPITGLFYGPPSS